MWPAGDRLGRGGLHTRSDSGQAPDTAILQQRRWRSFGAECSSSSSELRIRPSRLGYRRGPACRALHATGGSNRHRAGGTGPLWRRGLVRNARTRQPPRYSLATRFCFRMMGSVGARRVASVLPPVDVFGHSSSLFASLVTAMSASAFAYDSLWIGVRHLGNCRPSGSIRLSSRVSVPWIPGVIARRALQWVIGAWAGYHVAAHRSIRRHGRTAGDYFSYTVPATLLLVARPLSAAVADGPASAPRATPVLPPISCTRATSWSSVGFVASVVQTRRAGLAAVRLCCSSGTSSFVGAFARLARRTGGDGASRPCLPCGLSSRPATACSTSSCCGSRTRSRYWLRASLAGAHAC